MVVESGADEYIPSNVMDAYAVNAPHGRRVIIPHAKHSLTDEQKVTFQQLHNDWAIGTVLSPEIQVHKVGDPAEAVVEGFQAMGLAAEVGYDEPGTRYELESHKRNILYTVGGSISIRFDDRDQWVETIPGTELVVGENQQHEAIVGEQGWSYVAAWNPFDT
jgi:uncharacterized protein YaiE (UPF0345 family)